MSVTIDLSKCTACGECVATCPVEAITQRPDDQKAVVDADTCADCGACIDGCPAKAISM